MEGEQRICCDCLKPIGQDEQSQYFSNTKRWWHWICYQAWSKRKLEQGLQLLMSGMERRKHAS